MSTKNSKTEQPCTLHSVSNSYSVWNKLLQNTLFSLFGAVILGLLLWTHPDCNLLWAVRIGGVLAIFFMVLSSLFGDDEFNITKHWGLKTNKIKNIIVGIIAMVLMIGFIVVMIIIASFLFDPAVW